MDEDKTPTFAEASASDQPWFFQTVVTVPITLAELLADNEPSDPEGR